jgi:hypothetical protein
MNSHNCWIVRTTLDTFDVCKRLKRVGATANTAKRLQKFAPGDHGVFYISTVALQKSQTLSELRFPFKVTGNLELVPIDVPSLPPSKALTFSLTITPLGIDGTCKIQDLVGQLSVIKQKEYWSSYLMQAFIQVTADDFQIIHTALSGGTK